MLCVACVSRPKIQTANNFSFCRHGGEACAQEGKRNETWEKLGISLRRHKIRQTST